ncbi:MAG: hypothetical protein ACHQ17_15030, partial [Polyangia bacterium]
GGWTDNVLNLPQAESDFLFEVAPGLLLTAGSPRAVQSLGYDFTADLFVTHSEANSYTHQLTWRGFFLPSKVTQLFLSVAAQEGRLNTFNLQSGSALTPVTVIPAGGVTFFGLIAGEGLGWDITSHWRFDQSLTFNAFVPLDPRDQPNSLEVDQHLAASRSWRRDSLGLDYRLDVTEFTAVRGAVMRADGTTDPNGVLSAESQIIINSPVVKWRHDFAHFWNVELDGGFVEASLAGGAQTVWEPAALAAARWLHPNGSVELEYSHTVQPNPLIAETFGIDEVALRGSVPFGVKSHVGLSTSVAYQYAREIDFSTGGQLSTAHVILADATLGWNPIEAVQLFARYQYFNQIGFATDPAPQPSFSRNLVMIGVSGKWPGDSAIRVPSRAALRVDRADEVGIPSPHSAPPAPAKY